jgi:hypothetical protein
MQICDKRRPGASGGIAQAASTATIIRQLGIDL